MPTQQNEDRQTERPPVCLSKVHDSIIRILENPKNHVDGWTLIDRIQTRLPREYAYTVNAIRGCLSGCLASYAEVRTDDGTITHARRTDATYRYAVTATLLSHDKHVAQRKAWEKTINDLALYPNEPARDDLRRRIEAANIDPRPDWLDEYVEALEAGATTPSALPKMMKAVDESLLLMLTAVKEKGEGIENLRAVTGDLYQTLQMIYGAAPLPEKKTPPKKTEKAVTRDQIMKAASGSGATPAERAALAAKVEAALAAEDRQTEAPESETGLEPDGEIAEVGPRVPPPALNEGDTAPGWEEI